MRKTAQMENPDMLSAEHLASYQQCVQDIAADFASDAFFDAHIRSEVCTYIADGVLYQPKYRMESEKIGRRRYWHSLAENGWQRLEDYATVGEFLRSDRYYDVDCGFQSHETVVQRDVVLEIINQAFKYEMESRSADLLDRYDVESVWALDTLAGEVFLEQAYEIEDALMKRIEHLDFRDTFYAGRAQAEREHYQEIEQERQAREKAERQRKLFDRVVQGWLAFASLKKPVKIQKGGVNLLQRLHRWASNQHLEVLESLNACYPFSNSLSGFKWLPEGLLEEKRQQARRTALPDSTESQGGENCQETEAADVQVLIDAFLAEVNKIPGDKILTVAIQARHEAFDIDALGHIGSHRRHALFLHQFLLEAFTEGCGVIVRQFTNLKVETETPKGKMPIPIKIIRGAALGPFGYAGSEREDVSWACTHDADTGAPLPRDATDQYAGWPIMRAHHADR